MSTLVEKKHIIKEATLNKLGVPFSVADQPKDFKNYAFKTLRSELSPQLFSLLEKHSALSNNELALLKTSTAFNVENLPAGSNSDGKYSILINLKPINDTLKINDLFQSINIKLSKGGTFVGCVEPYQLRKRRLLNKYPKGFNYIYYFFDYIFKRVFSKINFLDKIYFFITAGRNRAISETEALGRLSYCGYEIVNTMRENNLMYFLARKVHQPEHVKEKNYRIFLRLPRRGKGGRVIKVYKLRTMFPYSEYLQAYIYNVNQLSNGGKFRNDFRISLLGRKLRKYFIDELPMLFNLLKGELKPIGVRPLSDQYFSLYDEELQEQRLKHKPGLIPPYYVDMPNTLKEIQASEKKYLDSYEKAPFKTDLIYFFKAFVNIIIKRKRSK